MESHNFNVLVICKTYNHAPYITDVLHGFATQQTEFPYICIIIDDFSTDGEPEVIQKYLNDNFDLNDETTAFCEETSDYLLKFSRHKTNHNCFFAVFYLKYNHYSIHRGKELYYSQWSDTKYIALCEGDDYWIDERKLQRQFDFLNNNQDYTMCFHNAIEHFEYGDKKDRLFSNVKDCDYSGVSIFEKWTIPTASVLFRREVLDSDLFRKVANDKKFIYGDTPLFVTCACLGKIRGISNTMSVYRRNENSVTHKKDYEKIKKQAYNNLEFYPIFGESYKKAAVKLYSRIMMSGFVKSLIDQNSSIRYDFLTESLSVSLLSTISALIRIICLKFYKRIQRLL